MAEQSTYERVVGILVDVLMISDVSAVHADAHIMRDLGAESINFAEITVAVEDEFGIAVRGADLQAAATVGSLAAYVDACRATSPAD